jgi:PAS domain S-box-containing protein
MAVMSDQPTSPHLTGESKVPRFVSLRWRFLVPLCLVVLLVAMPGAYFIARNLSGGMAVSQDNILLQSSRAVSEHAADAYKRQREEAQRIAFTVGVPEAIQAQKVDALHGALEGLARLAELDSIILTNEKGYEVLGLQRGDKDYAVGTAADLSGEPIIHSVLVEGYIGATGLLRTSEGLVLYTAVPVTADNKTVGIAMVGQRLDAVMDALKGSAVADVALYGADGRLLQTTFPQVNALSALSLAPEVYNQAIAAVQQIPLQSLKIGGRAYQGAYFPLNYGPNTLGVIAALMPDNVPFATELGRQWIALLAAALAGTVVIAAFTGISVFVWRVNRVTYVAEALASGEAQARTGMQATDEIGAMGQALDQYADYVQERHDALRTALRRQRREVAHLLSVVESLPDGIVLQDLDGRVILMNEYAKTLLGSQRVFRSSGLHELAAVVSEVLGAALAPGLYTLGDPQQISLDGKMLSAQAAAVVSAANHRLGTVIVLRDITEQVRQERAREEMLGRLMQDIQQPLAGLAQAGARSQSGLINAFAREITRHAIALQKMIVDMHEIADVNAPSVARVQRPIRLETLLWAVANEWRQVAQAASLTLHVIIERKGLYVLGDERRLRWAIGNVIDNAIKYTPAGGALTIEIQEESENGMGRLRVRDNGVGIAKDELPHIFTRFYRGNPVMKDGHAIRVPGMGQGLNIARQIFEAHGGVIHVKSTPGVGTAVYMGLPLTAEVTLELPTLDEADMDGETVLLDVRNDAAKE